MKKIKLLSGFAIMCCTAVLCFAGCSGDFNQLVREHISEVHNNYFAGSTNDFKVAVWSGCREEPYALDGIKNKLVEFCIVSIVPQNSEVSTEGLSFTIEINGEAHDGIFEHSPFDNSLAGDIGVLVNQDDEIYVYVKIDSSSQIAKMKCVSNEFEVDADEALQIALDTLGEDLIKAYKSKNPFEVYEKIITDTDMSINSYFWFVSFLNDEGKEMAVIIDPNTAQVIVKKV